MKNRILLLLFIIAALIAVTRFFDISSVVGTLLERLQNLGPLAPVVFIAIYIAACVLFIPGSILTLGAGTLFGVVKGTIVVSIGSVLGATAAFLIGRYLARDWVERKVRENPKFAAVSAAVAREGWKIVGLTRLSPIFPFNLLNYAYGITQVKLRDYVWASWLGMLPGTVMYVYMGSIAGSLANLGSQGHSRTVGEWVLYIVGFMATVAVTIYITRIARTALEKGPEIGSKGGKQTMTRTLSNIAALMLAANLYAEEHPKEHPAGTAPAVTKEHPAGPAASQKKEHPKGKEHPEHPKGKAAQAPEGSRAWMKQIRKEYDNAVCEYAKAKTKEPFVVRDEKLGKNWELKLLRVHKDRIVSLGNNRFFACSDFKSVKKGEKDTLDLDFFATKNPDGTWNVEKVLIHKVNGNPRYTWNEKNEMVPVNN